jgi:hypothetical protein
MLLVGALWIRQEHGDDTESLVSQERRSLFGMVLELAKVNGLCWSCVDGAEAHAGQFEATVEQVLMSERPDLGLSMLHAQVFEIRCIPSWSSSARLEMSSLRNHCLCEARLKQDRLKRSD